MNQTASNNPDSEERRGGAFRLQTHHVILFGLLLSVFVGNLVWVTLDTVPPAWDQARHLHIAFLYWQAFDWNSPSMWFDLLSVEPFYPPLYHLFLLPFMMVFGFSADTAVFANSVCLGVIILSTYGIGVVLSDRRAGLLAAFLVSCYPWLAYISRQCLIDTMLTAMVVLAYYLFLKSKNFEDRVYTFMFAVAFAAGIMVKWTSLVFVLPAVVAGLTGSGPVTLKKRLVQFSYYLGMVLALMVLPFLIFVLEEGRWLALFLEMALVGILVRAVPSADISPNKIMNLITLTVVSLLICFPWYGHAFLNLVQGGLKSNASAFREGDPTAGIKSWTIYADIIQSEVGGVLLFFFFVGLVFILLRKKNFAPLLIGWMVLPYIVFSLIANKDMRYIMPVLPGIAVISSLWVSRIQRDVFRRAVIGLAVVAGFATYLYSGFSPNAVGWKILGAPAFGYRAIPVVQHWPIDRVLDDILAEAALEKGEVVTIRTLTNAPYFQRGGFRDTAEIRGLPVVMKSVKRNVGEMTDFFITKQGQVGPSFSAKDINPKKKKLLEDPALRRTFPLFRKYPLPDGTEGLVFKRDVSPANDIEGVDDLEEVGRRFLEALAEYPIYGVRDGRNITLSVEPTENPDDLYLGRYKRITVRADSVVINKIRLHDFKLVFENIQINVFDLFLNGKLILFELDRIYPQGTIRFEELEELAAEALKGKGEVRLEGEGDKLILKANYRLPGGDTLKGQIVVRIALEPGLALKPILESLKLGPVLVPQTFYRRVSDITVDLNPTPGWPLSTDIRSVKIYPRRLEINSPGK